jgi:apolipoprotein D and lipocalin family protein
MATAFVVGGVATWLALGAARTARAQAPARPTARR